MLHVAEATVTVKWLLLIHQIPPKPAYLRVRIWRRLQQLGAVPIKNSVYILPAGDQAFEDFQWITREIAAEGGEASICEASFVDGLTQGQLIAIFNDARNADYAKLIEEAKVVEKSLSARSAEDLRAEVAVRFERLRKKLLELKAIDFFHAENAVKAQSTIQRIQNDLHKSGKSKFKRLPKLRSVHGATWVTRTGIHVDRMASAWLIRRFIDPTATFKFVALKTYHHRAREVRFDMFDAEYTHEGDRCTFEVLLQRFALNEPALSVIGEIVHDIDLKDSKFGRPETPGVALVVNGIAMANELDVARLDRASAVLDDIYGYFKRKEGKSQK